MNIGIDEIRKHRLTVSDYHKMGAAGVFKENERVELIEGEIYDVPPIGLSHSSIVDRLNERFVLACTRRAIVRVQNPITLGDLSEPQPDISLLRHRADFYENAAPQAEDVLLVVEVADSSLRHDRDVKLGLYARHSIPETWIIDVQARRMMCFSGPEEDGYREEHIHNSPGLFEPLSLPDASIDMSGVL